MAAVPGAKLIFKKQPGLWNQMPGRHWVSDITSGPSDVICIMGPSLVLRVILSNKSIEPT
jgi:hypothetical protein